MTSWWTESNFTNPVLLPPGPSEHKCSLTPVVCNESSVISALRSLSLKSSAFQSRLYEEMLLESWTACQEGIGKRKVFRRERISCALSPPIQQCSTPPQPNPLSVSLLIVLTWLCLCMHFGMCRQWLALFFPHSVNWLGTCGSPLCTNYHSKNPSLTPLCFSFCYLSCLT